jgi:diphthine-ammonia ligase
MSYFVSWSGGKDCCFACYKAISQGTKVTQLVNLRFNGSSHTIDKDLLKFQAETIGIPIKQRETVWENYERDFKETVRPLVSKDVQGIIFGDLFCEEFQEQKHKLWAERVCGELGLKAVEPLWGMKVDRVYQEFLAAGFEAVIISVNADLIGEEWLGQKLDDEFLGYLINKKLNACGELGEYHTLVVNGPLFSKKIIIQKSRHIRIGKYNQLEILKYA